MKRCSACRCEKPESEFYRDRGKRNGLTSDCKICSGARSKKWQSENPGAHRRHEYKKFGISLEQYDQMLLDQGGVCAICNQSESGRRLAIDHDHATGEVRGLLCTRCNTSLGGFLDRADLTTKATDYLLRLSTVPDSDWEL